MALDYPDISSEQLITALKKLGFKPPKTKTGGSHKTYYKQTPTGTRTCTVVEGRKSIPKGTLGGILSQGQIELEDLLMSLGGRYKREVKRERRRNET